MSDRGHEAVEELLKRVKREVHQVYTEASKAAQKRVQGHWSAFERKDAEKRALVKAGELEKAKYIEWRRNQMLTGKRFEQMAQQLAKDLTNADQIAMSIVRGYLPEAYAVNFNYGLYQLEHGLGINTGLTLYNREAVERLLRSHPELFPAPNVDIPKDLRWNLRHIINELTVGILNGESIEDVAARLQRVTDMDERAAYRNARTAMTGAQNAGREEAYARVAEMGVEMMHEWVAAHDGHTRASHLDVDGEQAEIGAAFSNGLKYPGDAAGPPEEVYNCFVGETKIASDSDIVRSYCHEYSGELIEIETARGVKFTCTPNHPILSERGWVGANALNEGDNLLIASIADSEIARGNPNIDHAFSRMDALHKFFDKLGGKRTCSLNVNFHGDIPTADVEIVTQKRLLRKDGYSCVGKRFDKFLLKLSNAAFSSNSAFGKHFWSVGFSAFCGVRRACKAFAFFGRRLLHPQEHSFGAIAGRDICAVKPLVDNITANAKAFSEFLGGFSCDISLDNIIRINRFVSDGCHVYNLQTDNGYYFVNSIIPQNQGKDNGIFAIAHNCRCTVVPVLGVLGQIKGRRDYVPSQRELDLMEYRADKQAHKMSFDEWMEARNG